MEIQRISQNAILSDEKSMEQALEKLKKVPDSDLHFYLVLRDTLNATAGETRKAITLAQVEWERRKNRETSKLAYRTTFVSGVVGIVGVILGALLANWLAP